MVRNIINQLTTKPNVLFLIDSIGSLLTAFFLLVVLRNFNDHIGLSKAILTYLSLIAICFCIYSTACFFFLKQNWTFFIRAISIANLLYCSLTVVILVINSPFITLIGLVYFILEIAIIGNLTYIELKVAAAIKKNRII